METDAPPDWVSVAEATRITGRSERTVRRWIGEERIPTRKVGGKLQVDVSMYRQATTGGIIDATGMVETQGRVSFLQNQVDTLTQVIDRQDRQIEQLEGHIEFLQAALAGALKIGEHKAIREPGKFRWPWKKD